MILNDKFTVFPTATFKEELEEVIHYFKHRLKELLTAKRFYKKVIDAITSLEFIPERYKPIEGIYHKTRILRKILVNNYVIIYEVNNNTRTSFYFTYIS